MPASQEVCDRIVAHYNANLSDEQICAALATEGIDMKVKNLSRLRQKLGMRRRSRFPEFREFEEEQREGSSYTYSPTQERERERERERATGADLAPAESPSRKKRKSHAAAAPTSPGLGLIPQVTVFVEKYMAKYDGSHDFHHVRRVVGLAHVIYNETRQEIGYDDENTQLDLQVITLAALLHDVGDRKYLEPGQDASTLVLATLLGFGASEDLAIKVQRIVSGVSYTSELADPVQTQTLILRYPELAIVQDADRLDAIGAVGIGRVFTYGGAKTQRAMDDSIAHFADKLEKLEGMMKTKAGLRLARQRTEKLEIFKRWWVEELQEAEGILRKKT